MSKLTPFVYSGPDSGVTLSVGTEKEPSYIDVLLRDGQRCDLPADHPVTATLAAQGFIAPLQEPAAPEPVQPAKTKTTTSKE